MFFVAFFLALRERSGRRPAARERSPCIYMITTGSMPTLFREFNFCLTILLYANITYRLLFFGAGVHPEIRY